MNGMLKIMGLVMLTLVAGAYGAGAGETVSGTVTDVDSNVYHTVTIGTQTWMVESLRTTRLNDGGALALVTNSAAWAKLETPGYCWYLNEMPAAIEHLEPCTTGTPSIPANWRRQAGMWQLKKNGGCWFPFLEGERLPAAS